jgi:hypothetical protein
VWVDATSVSGTLESELGLEGGEHGSEDSEDVVPVHVKTVSGDVSIVRAAAVSSMPTRRTCEWSAQARAANQNPKQATAEIDLALKLAQQIRAGRDAVLNGATATWYKTWYPRVAEANGRRFLHELDDVKDHPPDRTVDMSYLVYRERLLGLDEWSGKVRDARNEYARAHGIAVVKGDR